MTPCSLTSDPPLCSQAKLKPKRVKALYNCVADNPDELTFSEGDVIIVDGEEDQEWWVSRAWARGRGWIPAHLARGLCQVRPPCPCSQACGPWGSTGRCQDRKCAVTSAPPPENTVAIDFLFDFY